MAAIPKSRLFTEKALLVPRDKVGYPNLNRDGAPRARVLLCCVRDGNILNDE